MILGYLLQIGALLSLTLVILGASRCSHGVPVDNIMAAVEANDYTALIEGCGRQLSDGFVVCRKTEGDAAQDKLAFVVPPTQCRDSNSCASFRIFYPDGSPSYGGLVPKGKTRVEVPWEVLLKRNTFELGDRGFWGYSYRVQYIDEQGSDRETYSQGEIYMRVVKKGYISLHDIPDDPNFVWSWVEQGVPVRATTGMRTYVGRREP